MNTPLDLETSRTIFELVGWYETEKYWERTMGQVSPEWRLNDRKNCYLKDMNYVPSPTFGEVLREVWPKIVEKLNYPDIRPALSDRAMLVEKYCYAPTEPEAMCAVGDYLIKLLK